MTLRIKIILYALFFSACAASGGGNNESSTARYDENLITEVEIITNNAINAYDLIHNLRPHWLRSRGRRSIKFPQTSYPVVYVNENRYGDISSLSSIGKQNITEIRHLDAADATTFLGSNHAGGAILITIFY